MRARKTTYQGVVRGNMVVLPQEANLEDGTRVEVRAIVTKQQGTELEKEERFLRQLRAEGLLLDAKIDRNLQDGDRTPATVEGKPMSQMVIEDRR